MKFSYQFFFGFLTQSPKNSLTQNKITLSHSHSLSRSHSEKQRNQQDRKRKKKKEKEKIDGPRSNRIGSDPHTHILLVLALRRPFLHRVLDYEDEFFALLMLVLETHSLRTTGLEGTLMDLKQVKATFEGAFVVFCLRLCFDIIMIITILVCIRG
ncbi:uncharacterized protein LOC132180262 [Corylus avellana]|uniref:uncharacterized protein LOC132180262 n=1 Tax=Corylus avellana TaxID=13451 RepID=UPI00286BCA52|nr:uncharacterized protein LOC132180262 [Corylus avellana]